MAVSDRVKSGPEKAPHRSLWKALGLTDEELKLPLIGVVSAKSECVPGHNHLNNIAQAVKDGIRLAGGVPVEFPAIGVCDGIAMGHVGMKYSLASRELIADSCESMAIAHGFDGMVFIPNCDKIVPGMLMAARRLNLPAMVISGGPMMPGRMLGGSGDMDLNSVFEAVGAYKAGKMDDAQLNAVESAACPGCGSCSGMFTANSMNCITEVIGMALPGNGTIAAVDAARIRLAKKTGMRVVELVREGLTPEKIMTESAFRNALCLDMALGCSTNTVLHLPAIAHEAGIDFDLNWVNEASAKVPNLCHLAPAGHHHVIDLHLAGGVMGVLSELKGRGLLDENALTVSGMTLGEEISLSKNYNHEVIRPFDEPYSPTGGLMILRGNLAPDGAVVKRSAVAKEMLVHEGPARVFNSEDEAIAAIYAGQIKPGDVVVIRYEGPKGGPGMREMLSPTSAIAHHRRPLLRRNPRRGHRPCFTRGRERRHDRPHRGGGRHRHRHPERQARIEGGRRDARQAPRGVGLPAAERHQGLSGALREAGFQREQGRRRRINRFSNTIISRSGRFARRKERERPLSFLFSRSCPFLRPERGESEKERLSADRTPPDALLTLALFSGSWYTIS